MTDVKAMVLVEPRRLTASALPHRPIDDGGWLAVEATGLSGLEVQAWRGDNGNLIYPLIPGSQIVGRIAAKPRSDFPEVGTRVIVEPLIRCGRCASCLGGLASCTSRRPLNMYGQLPSTEGPGLWGGLAERVYLDPRTVVHSVTDDIQAEVATFAHPLASGYTWVNQLAMLSPGESVLILGPGPRGLSCVIAAQAAGAGWVGVSGLDHDADRLELAAHLGADLTVNIDIDDLGMAVAGSLGTRPDVVIDVTSNDPEAIYTGLDLVRSGGRVILASTKGNRPLQALFSDIIVAKELSIRGALGASSTAYEWACRQLECDPRIDDMVSHQFPLDESNRAIQATAGLLGHDELISVAVTF